MRATIIPTEIHVKHAAAGDDGWTHTVSAEDDEGGEVSILLSSKLFQKLWKGCEDPEVTED